MGQKEKTMYEPPSMQLAAWKLRLGATFFLVAFLYVGISGWREFQRGFTISYIVGTAFILIAVFNMSLLTTVLSLGRIPESWGRRRVM